jgi:hypothetical protein
VSGVQLRKINEAELLLGDDRMIWHDSVLARLNFVQRS